MRFHHHPAASFSSAASASAPTEGFDTIARWVESMRALPAWGRAAGA